MSSDDFAAQLAICARMNQQIGREEAIVEILQWGTANLDALRSLGLVESLLKVCGK